MSAINTKDCSVCGNGKFDPIHDTTFAQSHPNLSPKIETHIYEPACDFCGKRASQCECPRPML